MLRALNGKGNERMKQEDKNIIMRTTEHLGEALSVTGGDLTAAVELTIAYLNEHPDEREGFLRTMLTEWVHTIYTLALPGHVQRGIEN